jgi:hypothetical protein
VREGQIDEEVQAFLRQTVESHEHLEVLFLLRSHRDEHWSPEAVAEKLHIPPGAAAEAIDHLGRKGLVSAGGGSKPGFRYRPANESLDSSVDRLAQAYDKNRLGVIRRINADAIDRVRNAAIQTFVTGFRSRGENEKE